MSVITIRNVPDDIKQALKDRAKRHHRSMEKEALVMLMDAVETGTPEDIAKKRRQEEAVLRLKERQRWIAPEDGWRFDREAFYDADMKERGLL